MHGRWVVTSFVLLNQCSDAALTPDVLQQIADALDVQLSRDVAAYWGGNYRLRAATPDNPPAAGEIVATVLDDLPDAPGAVAYHNWQGTAVIFVARNMCSSLTEGLYCVSQALSHELCETVGDEGCNLWADDDAGSEYAHELCDAVEAGCYQVKGITVSDFLRPEFFDPGSTAGVYSYLGAPAAPFATAAGGYQVKRTSGTGETQVTGEVRSDRVAKKRHWSSRTYRRGARV